MFERIYIEKALLENEQQQKKIQNILARFPNLPIFTIESYRDVFGKFYKPYLAKRVNLWLFLAEKKGQLVKPAPPAYGTNSGKHFYFVHAYNCLYECQYCYLQGYFNSPDIVLFLNHEEIFAEIEKIIIDHPNDELWFHAGEFSDSLALTDLSQELTELIALFKKYPQAKLELRTKSIKIKELLTLSPPKNLVTSFSLSSKINTKEIDLKTPSLTLKIKAIAELMKHGHSVGLHFDPIVYNESFQKDYAELISELFSYPEIHQQLSLIKYISIGVVRFTKEVYFSVQKNYPESTLFDLELTRSFDGKMRYPKPQRLWIMNYVKEMLIQQGIKAETIYLCMEEETENSLSFEQDLLLETTPSK